MWPVFRVHSDKNRYPGFYFIERDSICVEADGWNQEDITLKQLIGLHAKIY